MTRKVVILHIGKTGGTAIRVAVRKHKRKHPGGDIAMLGHRTTLAEIVEEDPDSKIVFFVREPVSRFISGFNSRLRRGPSIWKPAEEELFAAFKTPNALAEALTADDRRFRRQAKKGMRASLHINRTYETYLGSVEMLEKYRKNILFIGQQETLTSDFEVLKVLLGMNPRLALPTDDLKSHRAPDQFEKTISEKGRRNIEDYYKRDLDIYAWCVDFRKRMLEELQSDPNPATEDTRFSFSGNGT